MAAVLSYALPLGAAESRGKHRGPTELARELRLSVHAAKPVFSVHEPLEFYVSLQNVGVDDVVIGQWVHCCSLQGGLEVNIYDEHHTLIGVFDHTLWPPAPPDDPAGFVRLWPNYFFGFRILLKDRAYPPGHYSVRVVYESHLRREWVPIAARKLPALWAPAPKIESEAITLEVTP